MFRLVRLSLYLVLIMLLQVSLLPAWLEDPFKPNLLVILVCYIALREDGILTGALFTYFSGLLQGVFSGLYFGLSGISYLLIYLFLKRISDQLYTESNHLIVFAVFAASIFDTLVSLVLISLFTSNAGIYGSFLSNMIPQAIITSIVAAVIFPAYSFFGRRFCH
jgi:rod shape-determining protein MreD